MAYLGFKKGAKCSLATSAHTKGRRGAKPSFPILLQFKKKNSWPKGNHGRFGQGVNTPLLIITLLSSIYFSGVWYDILHGVTRLAIVTNVGHSEILLMV